MPKKGKLSVNSNCQIPVLAKTAFNVTVLMRANAAELKPKEVFCMVFLHV